MAKTIRLIVVMEYEPQRNWYEDTDVEWEDYEAIAKYDSTKIMEGELIAPQDWANDVVKVVSAFVCDEVKEEMITCLRQDDSNG
jgi:hypothetical protein